jgi:hypothetical protein
MTHGFRARNVTGRNITIDANHISYVYLGKYLIPSQIGDSVHVDFSCVGTPLVFFSVPYNVTGVDEGNYTWGGPQSLNQQHARVGIAMSKLESIGTNSWRAWFLVKNDNGPELGLYLRVFGKLHLNPLGGTAPAPGLRIRKPGSGEVVFDARAPMLRLAGDTYSIEILLTPDIPMADSENPNAKDVTVAVPFNMANKSICATTRGLVHYPYNVASYFDDGIGQNMTQYEIVAYASLYWSNGSNLYVRRSPGGSERLDVPDSAGFSIDNSNCVNSYSRLAVIDNTKFP